jgi:hypothetical protein
MQTETIQQKAMQDIFALDEAVSQFESFGSQLDLGLPSEEDDTPKTFEDMLEVNPSDEPLEYGENFASEGDDMADKQTQKFVVDEFAKQASKLPDGEITAADITGISAVIQMTNHITGDVRSFIDQTINHAVQAQQQQNVSEAQPNGTVAQDIAKTGDEGADAGIAEDPNALGGDIPAMEPIDPTAEPTLDANPVDPLAAGGDPLADLGGDTLGAGMDDLGASIDGEGEADPLASDGDSLAAEGDLGGEDDPLAVEGDAELPTGAEGAESAGDEGGSELDNFLDADDEGASDDKGEETEDKPAEETETADEGEGEDKKSEDEDNDEDFNFEAIATKARGLVEGDETAAPASDAATEVVDEGKALGEEAADAQIDNPVDPAATETPADECGEVAAAEPTVECGEAAPEGEGSDPVMKAESVFSNQAAKVESIVTQARMKMAADNAKAVLESYHAKRDRASTVAKLESVVNNLKKNVQVESIIQKYGEASKKNAEAAKLESVQPKEEPTVEVKEAPKATFESVMASLDNALAAKKQSVRAEADKIIAEFESQHAAPAKDMRQENIDVMLESAARKVNGEKEFAGKLNNILEGVQKQKAASDAVKDIDAELNAIVESVKNA